MIEVLLSCRASPSDAGPTIDFDLTDSLGQTPLGLALWGGLRDVAVKLLHYGADVDQIDGRGFTLLHQVFCSYALEKKNGGFCWVRVQMNYATVTF